MVFSWLWQIDLEIRIYYTQILNDYGAPRAVTDYEIVGAMIAKVLDFVYCGSSELSPLCS